MMMKRSEINSLIRDAIEFMGQHQFALPEFATWSPADWTTKGVEADEIRDCALGWDLTDFGQGDFHGTGLILFTIRNGHPNDARYKKTYCEKIMISEEGQITPMHFHWKKTEDIINRGGGVLTIKLYNAAEDEQQADTPVTVSIDGVSHTVDAGAILALQPGESITLEDHVYHEFTAKPGSGKCLIGEVSAVNDDACDNRFFESMGRFPEIEEDEAPLHYLCNEYPKA
jgi:D-lyxose ketol-isomerase